MKTIIEPTEDGNTRIKIPIEFRYDNGRKRIYYPELPDEQLKDFSVKDWERFGFDNFSDDLLTKIWLVKARKCEAEVAALKEIYTEEVRARLSRLLHRIEYDLNVEENFQKLMQFCRDEQIFEDYLADFVNQVVVHKNKAKFIKNRAKDFGMEL